jgi:hypothetical protein
LLASLDEVNRRTSSPLDLNDVQLVSQLPIAVVDSNQANITGLSAALWEEHGIM